MDFIAQKKGLTCGSVCKSECVRRTFAKGAAITECTVGVICRAWGKKSMRRVSLNVIAFPEPDCILSSAQPWFQGVEWNFAPGADCSVSAA